MDECGRGINDSLGWVGDHLYGDGGEGFDELSASLTLELVVYSYYYIKGLETFLR